ncbi:membrane protein [Bacillus sp. JCM 19046]|nr:membrane protein [Bacillus sp. JCM 19045]GAF18034.1 membrane protein [Bacillus sp. JCM 19046]
MRIVWNELKKLLHWRMMLLLLGVNGILFYFLIEFEITNFPNGRPALDEYRIGIEMIEAYGPNMDAADLDDFQLRYEQQLEEADVYIQGMNELQTLGITTYEQFRDPGDELAENENYAEIYNEIYFEQGVDLFWEIQARSALLDNGSHWIDYLKLELAEGTSEQKQLIEGLIVEEQVPYYPAVVINNYNMFIKSVAMTVFLSLLIVQSPIFIREKAARTLPNLYTTKTGRTLFKKKLLAGFIASGTVTTLLLAGYFSIYSLNDTSMYFPVSMHSFQDSGSNLLWYDLTFLQYIIWTVIGIYLIGLCVTCFSQAASALMQNYVSILGVQIPLVFVLNMAIPYLLLNMLTVWVPMWRGPSLYILLLVISAALLFFTWKREHKRGIM